MGAPTGHARRRLRHGRRLGPGAESAPGGRFGPGPAARPEAVLAFALLYVVLGLVGRSTTIEGTPFGLVWPAGGVAVLWFLVRGAQARSVDTAVLVLASFVVNWVTGASPGISAVLVATNVLQTLLAVALLRRWCPRLWGCGGDHALDSPRVLARYLAAMSLATAAGALLGMTAFAAIEGHLHAMGGVLWFGRNLCSVLTVTTLGLLLGQRFAGGRPRRAAADTGGGNRLELLAAVACATGMYALGLELRRTEAEAVYEASVRDAIIGSMAEGLLVADDASSWSATRLEAGELARTWPTSSCPACARAPRGCTP